MYINLYLFFTDLWKSHQKQFVEQFSAISGITDPSKFLIQISLLYYRVCSLYCNTTQGREKWIKIAENYTAKLYRTVLQPQRRKTEKRKGLHSPFSGGDGNFSLLLRQQLFFPMGRNE
jgi:hypothetical protein